MAGYTAALVVVTAGAVIVSRAQPSARSAIRDYLAAALLGIGLATALATPETRALARALAVTPNLIGFISDLLAVGGAFCVLAMLTHTVAQPDRVRPRLRRQIAILILTVIAMISLFALSDTHTTIDVAGAFVLDPFLVGYKLLYVMAMCWAMITFIWLIRRYLSQDEDERLRTVLRFTYGAVAVGLVWGTWKLANLVTSRVGQRLPFDQGAVSELLAALLVILIGVGCTLPAWPAWRRTHTDRLRARRAFNNLAPLWRTLTTAVPKVTLDDTRPHRTIECALYRRVIEIRDAQVALRDVLHPHITDWARCAAQRHGVPAGPDTEAVIEAVELAAALHVREQRTASTDGNPTVSPSALACRDRTAGAAANCPSAPRQPTPPATVYAEADWLITMGTVLFTSPIVTDLLHRGSFATRCAADSSDRL